MTKKSNIQVHVTYDAEQGNWKVLSTDSKRAYRRFDTQKEAIESGKILAKNKKAEFIPHKKDGKISNPNTYKAIDPIPPADKKK